jgi:hypothetical protein
MVSRTPPAKHKAASPVQKYYKGDEAVLANEIILREGAILNAGETVTIIDVEPVARFFHYLVEIFGTETTAWVMEVELMQK